MYIKLHFFTLIKKLESSLSKNVKIEKIPRDKIKNNSNNNFNKIISSRENNCNESNNYNYKHLK